MRIFAIALSLLCLCSQAALAGQSPAGERRSADFFPVAVWYGGGKARAPMLEPDPRAKRDFWRADLKKIKELGFNTIRCWVDWATAEPTAARYNFDTVDVLMDLAEEAGLRVMIQVYADSAPDWVGKQYPDAHFISISGAVMPSESSPGYCFDHPGVGRSILEFYSALAERVKNRPAFFGWDLWSEPHVINWAQATYMVSPEFCFCPYTVARFREWLKKKYTTLDALNRAWYRRFSDWSEVQPNRLSTILSYTDYVDWRFFIIEKLAEDLRRRYGAVKKVAPDRLITSHAAAPSLFTSPLSGDGSPDDWLMAGQVDYWGTSFYPKHSFPVGRDVAWRGALLDFSRSACMSRANGFYVGELQGGFGTIALRVSSTVTPEDVNIWAWSAIARGAKGINFYAWYPMSSGYESGGFGLINLDGSITERARAAGRVAQVVNRNQELFLGARPTPAEVAIVYNPMVYMVGGRRPLTAAGAQGEFAGIERNSLLGAYRALFPANVPVDFIHINEIAGGKASRYKLIYLPYPLMISEPAAKALINYVRDGGALASEARLAWNDERGFAKEIIPGFGLHEVCGCRERAVQQTPGGKTDMEIVASDASIPFLQPGDRLRGALYEETLEPISENARVLAKFADGSPAMVVSTYGKGKMLAVGSFLGMLYEAERDAGVAKFFSGLLDWAGVSRPVEVTGEGAGQNIEVRTMQVGRGQLVFTFNHSSAASAPVVRVKMPAGSHVAKDLLTGERVAAAYERDGLVLKKPLAPGEVWVVGINAP
ncbi:MAG TPA: beta-galactosidase [Blastocatellia bacterium]|nr:beta-galactosidase [Blastocatellia bacterium]